MAEVYIAGVLFPADYDSCPWMAELHALGQATTSRQVLAEMEGAEGELTVNVNSVGGDVGAANSITIALGQWLKGGEGRSIRVRVCAAAYSAAALIVARLRARGATVTCWPETMVMFHATSCCVEGQRNTIESVAGMMDRVNESIVSDILAATTLDESTVRGWMQDGAEGWLTGRECVACGLAGSLEDGAAPAEPEIPGLPEEPSGLAAKLTRQASNLLKNRPKGVTNMEEENPKTVPEEAKPACETQPAEPEKEEAACPEEAKPACEALPAETAPAEAPAQPEAEKPEEPEKCGECEQLKARIAELEKQLAEATAVSDRLTGGLRTGAADAAPKRRFLDIVREAKPSSAAEFRALQDAYPAEYKAYFESHLTR